MTCGEGMREVLRGEQWASVGDAGDLLRLLLLGYFEGIDSERGIAWRAGDSLGLRNFWGSGWMSNLRIIPRFRGRGG